MRTLRMIIGFAAVAVCAVAMVDFCAGSLVMGWIMLGQAVMLGVICYMSWAEEYWRETAETFIERYGKAQQELWDLTHRKSDKGRANGEGRKS